MTLPAIRARKGLCTLRSTSRCHPAWLQAGQYANAGTRTSIASRRHRLLGQLPLAAPRKVRQPLRASDPGQPPAGLSEAAWRARALEDYISGTDGSGDYDAGIQAAQPQFAADSGIHEPQGVLSESGGEFGAPQARLIGDLENCRAHRQPRAWRQVCGTQVEIGVELITC
jgi:hypothetical protein